LWTKDSRVLLDFGRCAILRGSE